MHIPVFTTEDSGCNEHVRLVSVFDGNTTYWPARSPLLGLCWWFAVSCIDIRPLCYFSSDHIWYSLASHHISSFMQTPFCWFPSFLSCSTSHSPYKLLHSQRNTGFTEKMEDDRRCCSWSPECPPNVSAPSTISLRLTSTPFPVGFCFFSKLLPLIYPRIFSFSWTSCLLHTNF